HTSLLHPLSLHDALPIYWRHRMTRHRRLPVEPVDSLCLPGEMVSECGVSAEVRLGKQQRNGPPAQHLSPDLQGTAKAAHMHRGRSEEHTSELQSRFDLVC